MDSPSLFIGTGVSSLLNEAQIPVSINQTIPGKRVTLPYAIERVHWILVR